MTDTIPDIPGYVPVYSGKVRDLYAPLDPRTGLPVEDQLLLVASDRISAFDYVLASGIPDKGEVLTRLSLWWFGQLEDIVPHHLVDAEAPAVVKDRAVLCRRLRMLPVECIARAYLTGSGLAEYREKGSVTGIELPAGLEDGSRLEDVIFTPTTKAPLGEHDQPMTWPEVVAELGEPLAARVRDLTCAILARGEMIARERGILIADTKVEFGVEGLEPGQELTDVTEEDLLDGSVRVVLADEVLTPDSSRFWPAEGWRPGQAQPSFDKQYVRDWLLSPASGWDRASGAEPPALPQEVVDATRARYVEAYERLTGEPF